MKKILMVALGAGLLLGACSKDYLDISSTRYISKSDIDEISKTSPHLKDGTLNGLYAYNMLAFGGGTTGHDDFGQKGYDIYTDMLSGDMNLNSAIYGWYRGIADFADMQNYAANPNFKPWRFYYFMIRSTNQIITDLAGADGKKVPESNKDKAVVAEAKALRAYMYYNLVNMYTLGYDANEKVLPIYTQAVDYNTPSKHTQEVYALMIDDLTESLALYEAAGRNVMGQRKTIDYNVAQAILAYVYASKGTTDALTEAARLSAEVMTKYPLASKDVLLKGFNKVNDNQNWMWSGVIDLQTNLDLVSWWGQVDIFTYSYAAVGDSKGINKDLYDAIPANDVRKAQFKEGPKFDDINGDELDFGSRAILPVGKFFASDGKILMGARIIQSDYVYMRVEEMYLLNAEVNARLSNEGEAKASLKKLMEIRLDDVAYIDGLSGSALLDEILLQTRIELWGEGKTYAAIKRNKKDFKYGANHLYYSGTVFPYNDARLTFKVPQAEILNNPVYNN